MFNDVRETYCSLCGLPEMPGTGFLAQMLWRVGFRVYRAGKNNSCCTAQRSRGLLRNYSTREYPRPLFWWFGGPWISTDGYISALALNLGLGFRVNSKPFMPMFWSWLPHFRRLTSSAKERSSSDFFPDSYNKRPSLGRGTVPGSLALPAVSVTNIHVRPLGLLRHTNDLANATATRRRGFHLPAPSCEEMWIRLHIFCKGHYVRNIHDFPMESKDVTTVSATSVELCRPNESRCRSVNQTDKRKRQKNDVQSYCTLTDEELFANKFGEPKFHVDALNSTCTLMQKLRKVRLSGNFVARVLNLQREWKAALLFFRWAGQQEGYEHNAHIYRLVIHKLNHISKSDKNSRNVETVLILAQEMIEKGWDPGLSTSNFVVSELCRVDRVNSAVQFVQILKENCFQINSRTYNLLLSGLQNSSKANADINWEQSWQLYNEMQKKQTGRNCKPNVVTYGILTRGLCRAGKLDEAMLLLMSMKLENGCSPDLVIYSTLLTALTKAHRLHDACKVFEALEKSEHKPDLIAFSSLIAGLCNAGRLEEAFFLFSKMVRQGCKPDAVTCNSILNANSAAGQVDAAMNLFGEMKQIFAIRPNLLRHDCIIVALFRAGRIEEAMKVYHENNYMPLPGEHGASMSGLDLTTLATVINELCRAGQLETAFVLLCTLHRVGTVPSASTYMTVIEYFVKAGEWRKAAKLKEDMSRHYNIPGPRFYNNLIVSLGNVGELNDASNLFRRMEEGGFVPNVFIYNCGINWLGKAGKFSEASMLLEDMEARDCSPDVVTYNSLLLHACNSCSLDQVKDIFAQMIRKGCNPNVVTYSTLIGAMGNRGRLQEIWALVKEMKEKGCAPDLHTYNILMNVIFKSGPSREASRLLKSMERVGCPADVITYNLLIAGLGRRGQIRKAQNYFEQMVSKGYVPDVITHSTLITQLGRAGQWMVALNHFRLLQRQHCFCDVVVYNSIIGVLCKEGQLVEALNTVAAMEKQGYVPDVVTYNSIIAGFTRGGQVKEAIQFFTTMQQKGCAPDLVTYCTLILGLLKVERYVIVVQLLEQMVGKGLSVDLLFYRSLKWRMLKVPHSEKILLLLDLLIRKK